MTQDIKILIYVINDSVLMCTQLKKKKKKSCGKPPPANSVMQTHFVPPPAGAPPTQLHFLTPSLEMCTVRDPCESGGGGSS